MTVDLFIGFGAVLVLGGMCSLTAFKYLRREEWVPSALLGATNYEYATWLLFTFTAAIGMAGLAQFWFRRLWQKTYGTRAGVWTGLLATQLLLGAVMPVACLLMLNSHNLLMTWHSAVFALTAATYLRHALQVYRWAR
jgi:hypothetical protein